MPRRRGPKPIPRPPADELRRLYVTERHSLDVIGFHYSVSARTVRAWLRAAGIGRARLSWQMTIPAARLHALYVTQGLTIEQIAAQERVGPMAVWRALVAFDIPRRPHGRPVAPPAPALELRRLYPCARWRGSGWPPPGGRRHLHLGQAGEAQGCSACPLSVHGRRVAASRPGSTSW